MQLNPYGEEGASLAVGLVNAAPATPADILDLAATPGLILDNAPGEDDVPPLREHARRLAAVFDAATGDRISLLNRLLAAHTSHPWIAAHDGLKPHLHFRPPGLPAARQISAFTTIGLAWFLVHRGLNRIDRCEAGDCGRAFADTTRNGRQRYCCLRCANRDAVRRHRARASAD